MAKPAKFGKFVLLEEVERSALGTEYRAAKLGTAGLEKIVSLLRLSSNLAQTPDVARQLMEQVKASAPLQNPNLTRVLGIGKVESHYYIYYEHIEGKSLRATLRRCRRDGFPFSIDHALLIASKVCSALEHAHGRKAPDGRPFFHGHITPSCVFISYEGEVRTRGFGFWQGHLRDSVLLGEEERRYLAPEQASGATVDVRCDVFAVGELLYEALTGTPLFEKGGEDVGERLSQARIRNPQGEDEAVPAPIEEILGRSLATDPNGRYAEIGQLRKALDVLLFSGDFTPTTFNLAFFMHSLFREDIEREAKLVKQEREASYREYLTSEVAPPPVEPPAPTPAPEAPSPSPWPGAASAAAAPTISTPTPVPTPPPLGPPEDVEAPPTEAHPSPPEVPTLPPVPKASRAPLWIGLSLLVVVGGVAAVFLLGGPGALKARLSGPATPPPTTLSAAGIAAMERVKELESRLAALESERAEAEQQAADQATREVEAQAKASGKSVDPKALAKAQEAARQKAQEEQARKVAAERKRLEEEKRAEEARLAAERAKAEEEARLAAERAKAEEEARLAAERQKAEEEKAAREAEMARATPPPTPPPTTAPPVQPGSLVSASDPGVVAPVPIHTPRLTYPPIAFRQRVEGTIELNALIDEKGRVAEVKVVRDVERKSDLSHAAVQNVKERRYRPATKDGVPVKVWISVNVQFKLP
jgi:serine/threonine-protein kinase